MKSIKYRSENRLFKSKGFIAALSICLVAVGAAGWVAVENGSPELAETLTGKVDTSSASMVVTPLMPNLQSQQTELPSQSTEPSSPSQSKPQEQGSTAPIENQQTVAVVTPEASFFVMPITGEVIKSFSEDKLQYSMTYGDYRIHNGIDIAGTLGCDIHAAGDGTVISVTEDKALGKVIKINHGNGITADYCGLSETTVKNGDTVKANQTIGVLGEIPSEAIEAVHLHFSMTKDNKAIDPLNIIGVND